MWCNVWCLVLQKKTKESPCQHTVPCIICTTYHPLFPPPHSTPPLPTPPLQAHVRARLQDDTQLHTLNPATLLRLSHPTAHDDARALALELVQLLCVSSSQTMVHGCRLITQLHFHQSNSVTLANAVNMLPPV